MIEIKHNSLTGSSQVSQRVLVAFRSISILIIYYSSFFKVSFRNCLSLITTISKDDAS